MKKPMLEWKTPPESRGWNRESVWEPIAEELRQHPGQWARVKVGGSSSTAADIKGGKLRGFGPAGSFDAISRSTGNGKADIYARFVGEIDYEQ